MNNENENEHLNQEIDYPNIIRKLGVWPVNIGLFFFYSNVVSIAVLIFGIIVMHQTGVTDQRIVTEKLGGLSVISTLITLGLTMIYSDKFYFKKHR